MVLSLYKAINNAIEKAVPNITLKKGGRSLKWYTDTHLALSKTVNKLYIRAMKSKKHDDLVNYKKENKKYLKKCRKDRNKAWKRYIDCIKSTKELARLTKLLHKSDRNSVNVFDSGSGSTEPGEETLGALLNTHFKDSTETPHHKYNADNSVSINTVAESFEDWISLEKIKDLSLIHI